MADNFKKSGLSFEGVSKAEFEAAQNLREQDDLAASMAKRYKEINDNRKKTGDLECFLKGELAEQKQILADNKVIPLKICNLGFSDHFKFFLKKKNIFVNLKNSQ